MVSVITLTYKNFDGLFRTITSVLEQDWPEFEYIISDDGSGNFPKQEVIDFVEQNRKDNLKRFEVFDNKINVGTVKHLNNAIRWCEGEYIFDLSCNDLFVDEHTISRIIQAFDEEQCDVLFISRIDYKNGRVCAICPHYHDRKRIHKLDTKEKRLSAFMLTEHCDMFIGPNVIYKKSVIERNGYFDENYVLFEDAPMIAKMIINEKVSIRPDLFYVLYDCATGVSAPRSRNPILSNDINRYNSIGKMEYYDQVDNRARYHIRFGVERVNAKNSLQLMLVCIKYLPRIVGYSFYSLGRKISGVGDRCVIKKLHSPYFDERGILCK